MKWKLLEFVSLEKEEKGDAYNPQEIHATQCMMIQSQAGEGGDHMSSQ